MSWSGYLLEVEENMQKCMCNCLKLKPCLSVYILLLYNIFQFYKDRYNDRQRKG